MGMGMDNNKKFFNAKNNFSKPEFKHEVKPVTNTTENVEEKKTEVVKELDKTNYLNIGKEPKEKLVSDGSLFKHATVVKCNTLNFRQKPNKTSEVLGIFNVGENILYSETDDPAWFKVKDKDGKIGYCMSDYIKIEI